MREDYHRGHRIQSRHFGEWYYAADGVPVPDDPDRPCGHCGRPNTPEGHDACLGTLPGVRNACCGHGLPGRAYIQFQNGVVVRHFDRIENEEPWWENR